MEIDNILDALLYDNVSEIIQYCECTYNGKTVEFRLVNDEFGVIDDIEFPDGDEWFLEYSGDKDEDVDLIIDAITNAPYEVFHKSDVGAKLLLNHESIKVHNVPNHYKMPFYIDEEGPIEFTLIKNIVELE